MLIDSYPFEDVFARVPELAHHTDPVLRQLDALLDDDRLYQQVHANLGRRYPLTLVAGRHSDPVRPSSACWWSRIWTTGATATQCAW